MENERRLIDANILESWIDGGIQGAEDANGIAPIVSLHDVLIELDNIPTVDAVEVVHGQWIKVKDGFDIDRGWKCSSCNNSVYEMTYEPYKYCPHCGAMMGRERKKNG